MTRWAFFVLALLLCANTARAQKIVVDPGHGGDDPGGVGNGLEEKDIVLDTAFRLQALIEADSADSSGGGSWQVSLTRVSDVFVGLSARADYANAQGADRFMSIHANAFGDPQANGIETFAFAEGGDSAAFRNLVQEEMIAAWPLTNRGNKTANFAVLRETDMPAELHELAFITNSTDISYLSSATQRQKAAEAHLRALQRDFGIAPYIPQGVEAGFGSLLITVSSDGSPLAGAQIGIDGANAGSTGTTGVLQFENIPAGSRIIDAKASGYVPRDQTISVSPNTTTEVSFSLVLVPTPEECAAQACREGCPDALTPACAVDLCVDNPCEPGCPEAQSPTCVPGDLVGCGCQSHGGATGDTWFFAGLVWFAVAIRRRTFS